MANRIYWLHALTPTHTGVGRGVGYIDLPIDRDAVTNWPLVRGSAFKGVWADYYGATEPKRKEKEGDRFKYPELRAAFGVSSDATDNAANSGSLIPTDARLVCLPVRSFRGTFAWCTSRLALQLLHRTLDLAGLTGLPGLPPVLPNDETCYVLGSGLLEGKQVFLQDLDFAAVKDQPEVEGWAESIAKWVFPGDPTWPGEFKKRFTVLPDVVFDFLTETGTEVQTRVKISDETKTVADKALWTEESLPAETILAGVVACDRVFGKNGVEIKVEDLLEKFARDKATGKPEFVLQIGGKATVGRGQVRCVFTKI
ncbi:MAG TPA: type III-B CRISPR module RAMP protein Cmr4 [Gemmataceae bacterium]|nr:type III-B CRISPR module RAMP protein Cmr4 [Gemmataceae bacterium]